MTPNFERFQKIQKQADSENYSSICHLEPEKCQMSGIHIWESCSPLCRHIFFTPAHRSMELFSVNCNWCEEQEKEKDLSANFSFNNTYFLHNTIFGNQVGTILFPKSFSPRVSVQGVKSLGGHFACLCRGFELYEVKKKFYYFSKRKWKYFYTFYHFYSEKSSKRAK